MSAASFGAGRPGPRRVRADDDGSVDPDGAVEHLVGAARDLIGAARSVLDALEAVLDEQVGARSERRRTDDDTRGDDDHDPLTSRRARVRRIDVEG